jgi:hypothetical protein
MGMTRFQASVETLASSPMPLALLASCGFSTLVAEARGIGS